MSFEHDMNEEKKPGVQRPRGRMFQAEGIVRHRYVKPGDLEVFQGTKRRQLSTLGGYLVFYKSYDKPRQCIIKQRHHLPTNTHTVKAMFFPVVKHGCESWTIKKAEC